MDNVSSSRPQEDSRESERVEQHDERGSVMSGRIDKSKREE